MKKRVTITNIAHEAGVSHSTVSRALKNDPRISQPVRKKIHEAAARLGYIPDPRMSELMSRLRAGQTAGAQVELAWINHKTEETLWRTEPWSRDFLNGARSCAARHGYKLVEFWLGSNPLPDTSAVEHILRHRNIRGLLIPPLFDLDRPWTLDWSRYSAVSISPFPFCTGLDCADSDDYHDTLTCMKAIREHGHRRIGFVSFIQHFPTPGNPLMAAWLEGLEAFGFEKLPAFRHSPVKLSDSLPAFRDWFSLHRPTVILSESDWVLNELKRMKINVPAECSVVLLDAPHAGQKNVTGLIPDFRELSATAVDTLHARLLNHTFGLPKTPVATLIRGRWQSGRTLAPPLNS